MYDVSICIVSHNNNDDLLLCLDSIYEHESGKISFQVIVIDNVCDESVEQFLKRHNRNYNNLSIIRNQERYNFACNNNIAIKNSTSKYILVLNPDTEFLEPTLEPLFRFMEHNKNAGVVSTKLVYPDGSYQYNARRFPNLKYVVYSRLYNLGVLKSGKILNEYYTVNDLTNEVTEVDYVIGAFMFIRNSVLEQVGVFDEKFVYYGEDTDLCFRIKSANWKICYIPTIKTLHIYRRTGMKRPLSRASLLQIYTFLLFRWKNYWFTKGLRDYD